MGNHYDNARDNRAVPKRKWFGRTLLGLFLCFIALLPAAALRLGVDVTRYDVAVEGAPELRIVQLSDNHWRGDTAEAELVLGAVERCEPDLIFLTGDTIDKESDTTGLEEYLRALTDIAPVYAVTGNHDRWDDREDELRELYAASGVTLMDGETHRMTKGGVEFRVHGIADPEYWGDDPPEDLLDAALSGRVRGDGLDILLFHRGNMAELVAGRGFDLVFSGHMHGGAVVIPFVGGVASPTGKLFPEYTGGLYELSGTSVIVNRGCGEESGVGSIPRVFNRPEVVLTVVTPK